MAEYGSITRFVPILESASAEQVADVLYHELVPACYDSDVLDHDYRKTIERNHIDGNTLGRSNIESFSIEECVASLTLILRKDRASNGFSKPLLDSLEDGVLIRILKRLGELDQSYRRPNVVTFYHEYERDGYLSNWYKCPFDFCGTTFPTSEHWMMWQKACVFRDPDTAAEILRTNDQGTVKHLGKRVHGYSDNVWDAVNQQLMRVGLRQKFVQNERLLSGLLSTGSAVLGEAAGSKDPKWGVGLAKGDPELDDPASWHGRNLLGRTLMDVRSDLRALCARQGALEWSADDIAHSQIWGMSLLELARVPSTRALALMYATIVAHHVPAHFHGARDVLRKVRASIRDIDESMSLNMGSGLPVTGWAELVDELALQVRLGRI